MRMMTAGLFFQWYRRRLIAMRVLVALVITFATINASSAQPRVPEAQVTESLGHRPRNRFISNTNALKGQNCGRASSFRPVGAVCVSIHFSQGDALGFRILGLWPGTHSAPQCRELSRPLTANAIQLGCGRSPRQALCLSCA